MLALDQDFLEMRVRSVYSAHSDEKAEVGEGEENSLLLAKLPGYEREPEEGHLSHIADEEGRAIEPHATGLGGTLPSATLGIIKGMVGPAILYLPHGFASAGYLVAMPVLMLSTVMFLWSSGCLLESWKMESERVNRRRSKANHHHHNRIILSYPELAYRAFGPWGERLVQLGISLMQSGVCLTYLIFVPQNLHTSALLLMNWDVSTTFFLAIMMAVQIPMSWIRDIRRLTMTNLLANALILYGLVTCLGFAWDAMRNGDRNDPAGDDKNADDIDGEGSDVQRNDTLASPTTSTSFLTEAILRLESLPPFNAAGWFLFLGTSVLLFEGSITLLVPLQEAVHSPADRLKFPTLYRKVILGIVAFYSFFGITCWMAFGNDVRTVMTTSLPAGTLATTVQLAYSLAVVFTFPLQNFPSLEIVCRATNRILARKCWSDGGGLFGKVWRNGSGGMANPFLRQRNIVSTLLVVSLSVVAVTAMNDLDKVVSLMGSLLGCPLAFVVPPLIHNRLGKGRLGNWRRVGNLVVATLGVVAMCISSITTVIRWD